MLFPLFLMIVKWSISFHSTIIITNLTTLRCCTIFTVHYAHSHIFHVRYLPIYRYIYVREMKNLAINFHCHHHHHFLLIELKKTSQSIICNLFSTSMFVIIIIIIMPHSLLNDRNSFILLVLITLNLLLFIPFSLFYQQILSSEFSALWDKALR